MKFEISSVALAVWFARFFTSDATTANPLPASPALAASIVALSAKRLICYIASDTQSAFDLGLVTYRHIAHLLVEMF